MMKKSKTKSRGVVVHVGQFEFLKINTGKREWRDAYHWILSLSWPHFAALLSGGYIALNLVFGVLYFISDDCIAEMPRGSFSAAFFFSVQCLATVGYGHMYPVTLYGNVLTSIVIMVGTFGLAVMTGLIFIRFSRPRARIEFTRNVVIAPFNGQPTLMFRGAGTNKKQTAQTQDTKIISYYDQRE